MRLQFLLVLAAFLIHTIVDFTIDSVTHLTGLCKTQHGSKMLILKNRLVTVCVCFFSGILVPFSFNIYIFMHIFTSMHVYLCTVQYMFSLELCDGVFCLFFHSLGSMQSVRRRAP